ncbi:MAG: DUF6089 family protein [Bacteroidales bacterium]
MNRIKKVVNLFIVLFFITNNLSAQTYKYEIGPTAGAASYSGDANGYELFAQPELMKGLSIRRNFNLRTALNFDLLKASVTSSTQNTSNVLPNGLSKQFSTSFYDFNAHLEYSFFSYSDSFKYKETRRFTPYIFAGVGATVVTAPSNMTRMSIPVGVGLKYKIFKRVNVGTELSMNLLLSDRLERIEELDTPYGINSQSIFKNTDMYSYLKFYITFDIIKPACKCNKN